MTTSTRNRASRAPERTDPQIIDHPPLQVLSAPDAMVDLAPGIHRQRLVIEGLTDEPMTEKLIADYLQGLAPEVDMVPLTEPVLHRSTTYGWAGWIHWETSGCHVYAWDDEGFFSVDIYTCKPFDPEHAATFTAGAFKAHTIEKKTF